ncbi:MAG TPA: flagellar basal body L-ring protein FlgH [Gammaproteobacteria bacterium]|nr:flagellar basal body L-ring protein FlgH [Gammaproteobacteria bacterium]
MNKRYLLLGLVVFMGACSLNPKQTVAPEFVPVRPIIAEPPPAENGGLYQTGYGVSLFSDVSAKRVGDLITVVLSESTNAKKNAVTNTSKESSLALPSPTLFGNQLTYKGKELLSAALNSGNSFTGTGNSTQSNSLEGRITVTVSEVLANGYLMVQGEKRMTLNQGSEHVRFSGIVRPADIRNDNTVLSTSVANAQIIYAGTGTLADANTQGWLGRLFNTKWWPF